MEGKKRQGREGISFQVSRVINAESLVGNRFGPELAGGGFISSGLNFVRQVRGSMSTPLFPRNPMIGNAKDTRDSRQCRAGIAQKHHKSPEESERELSRSLV